MKKLLFASLLLTNLVCAKPNPGESLALLDRPASVQIWAQRENILKSAEAYFRARNDRAGLLEVECRRLEPLLLEADPRCPEAMQALSLRVQGLPPGRARAYYYWLCSLQARNTRMRSSEKVTLRTRYEDLALAEPGLPDELKAAWLDEILRSSMPAPRRQELYQQLRKLPESPLIFWHLQGAQQRMARDQGNTEMERTLALTRLQQAEREGWVWEQFQMRTQAPLEDWKQARRLALLLPRSPQRDPLLMSLLREAPDRASFESIVAGLEQPDSLLVQFRRLKFFTFTPAGRAERTDPTALVGEWEKLIEACRSQRNFDVEVRSRQALAGYLGERGRAGEETRQWRAALQTRLDHPQPHPEWSLYQSDLHVLVTMLAQHLATRGQIQQALALQEKALESGWLGCEKVSDHEVACLELASHLGDHDSLEKHWLAVYGLLPGLDNREKLWALERLCKTAPPGQVQLRPKLLAQLRALSEAQIGEANSASQRHAAIRRLAHFLVDNQDLPGARELWRSERERALRNGDPQLACQAGVELLERYRWDNLVVEVRDLGRELKGDPALTDRQRRSILHYCDFLAKAGEAEGLVWADELVKMSRKPGVSPEDLDTALQQKIHVLRAFKRYPEALQCLQELETRPTYFAWERGGRVILRAQLLGDSGRSAEAVALLRQQLTTELTGKETDWGVEYVLGPLCQYLEELDQPWQPELEAVLRHYQALGEEHRSLAWVVLKLWLKRLASKQQWEEGRAVLSRYPWTAPAVMAKELRVYKAWSDLLPADPLEAGQPSSTVPTSLATLVDQLRLSRPDLSQLLSLRSTNLSRLQTRLGPNDTLVTYCNVGEDLYVLALRAQDGFWKSSKIGESQLAGLVQRYLQALRSGAEPGEAEQSLYSMLLEPVLNGQPDQRLLLLPTHDLWQLPFGALRDPQGRSAASRADLVLMTSGDLLRLADDVWKPYQLSQPLAIGAPPAADLPGASKELQEVSQLLPGCQLSRGDQATLKVLFQPGQRWGLLHFASHAHYRPDQPTESDIQLHDGLLQLKQLPQLAMAEHTLVALSCCQGGASKGQALDEPVTLATGFSAAGAETVVGNLWNVDDEVARAFFTSFYSRLASGGTPMQSFRQAQDSCRQSYPQARDWAGFFLLGNPL